MEIKPFTPQDLPKLPNVQPGDWPDITPFFQFYLNNSAFTFPIKMVDRNELIGVGSMILNGKTSWLAHIIVSPVNRGRGIGYQITNELVRMSNEKKCETISLIATELGRPVYEKLGFQLEEHYHLMIGPKIENHFDEANIQELKSVDNITEMDANVSGENRNDMLKSTFNNGKVYFNGSGKIKGYYLPNLGEGLIYSESLQVAKSLLALRCNKETNKIGLPQQNLKGIEFLEQCGYKTNQEIARMYVGEKLSRQPEMVYSRAGGFYG